MSATQGIPPQEILTSTTTMQGGANLKVDPKVMAADPSSSPVVIVPGARTIAVTIRPDWIQAELRSMGRAATILAMFGPPNCPPLESRWMFEFNVYCTDRVEDGDKKAHKEEHGIDRRQRALLWWAGRPFDKYKGCVVHQKCRYAPEVEPLSVVFRLDPKDSTPGALSWVRRARTTGPRRRRDLSYVKVLRNHFYHLNVTFANGDIVHRYVHQLGWRFTLFLLAKKQKHGADEITMTRLFTSFSTAWVIGNEPTPDAGEMEMAAAARVIDAEEDREEQTQLAHLPAPPDGLVAKKIPPSSSEALLPPGVQAQVRDLNRAQKMGVDTTKDGLERSMMMTAAVPSQHLPPFATSQTRPVKVVTTDVFSPMTPLPSQPSAPLLTAMLQPVGPLNVPRSQPAPRPKKAGKDCSWEVDIVAHLSPSSSSAHKASSAAYPLAPTDYDPPDIEELQSMPSLALPFTLEPFVEKFVAHTKNDGSLSALMCDLERHVRCYAADRTCPISDHAKVLMNTFSAVAQLPGWQHVQDYIVDPNAYVYRIQALGGAYAALGGGASVPRAFGPAAPPIPTERSAPSTTATTTTTTTTTTAAYVGHLIREDNILPLQEQGKVLLHQLCTRVAWLRELKNKTSHASKNEPELVVRAIVFYLAADRKWIADAQNFMKEAELRVTQMLTRNATRFAQFRELQKAGVAWPHSVEVRRDIERAGFTFRPMMIKRDRCVCDVCLVEVSGWRPWHNPMEFHDFARHPQSFRPTR